MIARAAAWAGTGSIIGVLTWSALAATMFSFSAPADPWWRAVTNWPLAFLGSAYWAAFVGVLAFPVYTAILTLWLLLRHRVIHGDALARPAVAALALGSPLALGITWSFAATPGFTFDWGEAARLLPVALGSCWLAIGLPPRLFPSVRLALRSAPR